jgi:hypothetical protein
MGDHVVYAYQEQRVVQDGLLVTRCRSVRVCARRPAYLAASLTPTRMCGGVAACSRGPGTTFDFALTLLERLEGKAKRDEISAPMMLA